MKSRENLASFLWLLLGTGFLLLTTWRWNVPLAGWLAPLFLMRFVRTQRRGPAILLALPLMAGVSLLNKWGAWDMGVGLQLALCTLAILPLFIALCIDRWTSRRLAPLPATLVFPSVVVALDFLLSLLPLGTVFSLAASQFSATSLIQMAALTGSWGIAFVLLWLAPAANRLWEQGFDLRRAGPATWVCAGVVTLLLLAGGAHLALGRPASPTVKIAGVTVAHPRPYWDEIVDQSTPAETVHALEPELLALEDALFAESERAAAAGAQIIFWSEGNVVLTPERRDAFIDRAQTFARQHEVYLMPAYLIFQYGQATGDNGLLLIEPNGQTAFTYTKTKSWYATDSDGLLHSVDTPYGRLSTAICFDMDFPAFLRQAARQHADILLAPAFDTIGTRPYHTEVGLLRAVDYGFSIVRQVNEGASMAVDYQGRVLAYQDFFTTERRLMLADVPTAGVRTLYGRLGDWLVLLTGAYALGALIIAGRRAGR